MLLFNTKGVFVDQILYLYAINSKVKGQVVRQFFVRSVIYIVLLLHVSKQDYNYSNSTYTFHKRDFNYCHHSKYVGEQEIVESIGRGTLKL